MLNIMCSERLKLSENLATQLLSRGKLEKFSIKQRL